MTILESVYLDECGFDTPLRYEKSEGEPRAPEDHEVVVAVARTGVAHRDLIDRAGRIPYMRTPIVPGHESAGRVVAVGADVTDFAVGDAVATLHRDSCGDCERCDEGETGHCLEALNIFGLLADGGYASHIVAPARAFYALPDDIDMGLGACLCSTFGTAYRAMNRFIPLREGVHVLITGANGGVGTAAIQVAKAQGATVSTVVRNAAHADALRALGADYVIVDEGRGFHKEIEAPADVALDLVGAPTFNSAARALRIGGAIGVVGNIVDARVEVNLGFLCVNDIRMCGSTGATRADMAAVLALHEQAGFTQLVHATRPLADADAAQRELLAGGVRGRILLQPDGAA